MIFILVSILFNTYVGVIFKHFGKLKINAEVAIVVNYWICVITGIIFLKENPFLLSNIHAGWFPFSLVIGALLITIFNVMSHSSVQIGVTLTQAANKLSLAIPVFFSFYLYSDEITLLKIFGIILAILGVYFITLPHRDNQLQPDKNWWLLPALFIGSGTIDTITKYVENSFIQNNITLNHYLIFCFGAAAVFGTIYIIVQVLRNRLFIDKRSLIAGVILGIPNYFSIYFLIKALQYKGLSSSAIIPINNIGILIIVTFYGLFIFKEHLNLRNKIGLLFALTSIILLLLGT
jgi:drug/metabolite transporter (DMT)-like permease